jgi:hypothetical protein
MRAVVSTCPSSSWNSRARRARSCSTRSSRWLASRRNSSRERSRSCCACFSAVTSSMAPWIAAFAIGGHPGGGADLQPARASSGPPGCGPPIRNRHSAGAPGSRQHQVITIVRIDAGKKRSGSLPDLFRRARQQACHALADGLETRHRRRAGIRRWPAAAGASPGAGCPPRRAEAISAWRRRDASPWRRRQDQNAKPVISASTTAISTMAESVNCRDEATVMCLGGVGDRQGDRLPG